MVALKRAVVFATRCTVRRRLGFLRGGGRLPGLRGFRLLCRRFFRRLCSLRLCRGLLHGLGGLFRCRRCLGLVGLCLLGGLVGLWLLCHRALLRQLLGRLGGLGLGRLFGCLRLLGRLWLLLCLLAETEAA